MSKDKGARFELALAKKFSKWGGVDFARSVGSGNFSSQHFGYDGLSGDIVSPDGVYFPISIEAKHHESVSVKAIFNNNLEIPSFVEQSFGDAIRVKKVPFLIMHANRTPNYLMTPYSSKVENTLYRNNKRYIVTFNQYKDDMLEKVVTFKTMTFILEDFFELYTIGDLVKFKDTYKDWYSMIDNGTYSERHTGRAKNEA